MTSRSRVEMNGDFLVKHSGKVLQSAKNVYVEIFDPIDDDEIYVVQPRPKNFLFSVSPDTLRSLDGDLLHVTFTGTVNVAALDPRNVQKLFMKCFAKSNINWYWKSGLSQPYNKVEGVATVLLNQYETNLYNSENFDILMNMYVQFTTVPQDNVDRQDNGQEY